MRPAIRIALLGLIIAALVGAPTVSAHGWRSHHAGWTGVQARAGTARQGGSLLIVARVRLPRGPEAQPTDPSARAVVHFASGDVSVDLAGQTRSRWSGRLDGRGWWAPVRVWRGLARVAVPIDQPVGRVRVDVTVTMGDGSVTVATVGRIRPARTERPPTEPPTIDPPCTAGCQET